MKTLSVNYSKGQLFQHVDGGFYKFEKSVWFADDEDELVIYQHVWPFTKSTWARRSSEFLAKFTPIEKHVLDGARKTKKEIFQAKIAENKKQRRALNQ